MITELVVFLILMDILCQKYYIKYNTFFYLLFFPMNNDWTLRHGVREWRGDTSLFAFVTLSNRSILLFENFLFENVHILPRVKYKHHFIKE